MSLKNRAKSVAKNIEGKIQKTLENLTGDPKAKAEENAKQAESQVRHAVEYMKDRVKKILN